MEWIHGSIPTYLQPQQIQYSVEGSGAMGTDWGLERGLWEFS